MSTTTNTKYAQVLETLEEEGFEVKEYTATYKSKGIHGANIPARVIQARGVYGAPYTKREAILTVWFNDATRAFIGWDVRCVGVTFSGFPNTLKALLEDDGYGAGLIMDLSPKRAEERIERRRIESVERNEMAKQRTQEHVQRIRATMRRLHAEIEACSGSQLRTAGAFERYAKLRNEIATSIDLAGADVSREVLLKELM